MLLRQKSALDGFAYEFLDGTENLAVGGFHYAWFAQAKNARLRVFSAADAAKGDIQMTLHGQALEGAPLLPESGVRQRHPLHARNRRRIHTRPG